MLELSLEQIRCLSGRLDRGEQSRPREECKHSRSSGLYQVIGMVCSPPEVGESKDKGAVRSGVRADSS